MEKDSFLLVVLHWDWFRLGISLCGSLSACNCSDQHTHLEMVAPAVVLDNGSFECRAGFSNKNEPMLQFRNVVMKSRSRMRETFVGLLDEMDFSQVNSKSAFEQNTVTQLDVQETVFDHIFYNIGIESSGVDFPVILSEPLCCPQQSRSRRSICIYPNRIPVEITELLFETYAVNKLTYFVDGLASFYANFGSDSLGIFLSCFIFQLLQPSIVIQ